MGNYNKNLELLKDGSKESLNKFAELNFPLVLSISKKFLNRGYEYEDIFQIGCLGLTKAVKQFNFNYNVKFSTYAYPMVMGEIKRFLRDNGIIRVPRSLKTLFYKIHYGKSELSNNLNREPTIQELSKYLHITKEEIKAVEDMHHVTTLDSLDRIIHSPHKEGTPVTLGEKICNKSNLEEDTIQNIDLKNALEKLPPMQRKIIDLRIQDYTQVQAAKILGIGQVQVSRLENKAYIRLKQYLGSDKLSKKDDAIKLFKQGLTTKEVIDKLHITKSTATTYRSYYLRENKIPSKKEQAFKMFSQHFKNPAIEKAVGLTKLTVATYKHDFIVAKGKVFARFVTGKSESEISKELKLETSLVHNLRREWASTPMKPGNEMSSNTTTKVKPINPIKKKADRPIKVPESNSVKPKEEIQSKNIKENEEEIYMLKPLLLKGDFAKYDLQQEGKVKVICDKEIALNPEQVDLFIQELQQVKKAI